jgi:hypothetical protein
MPGVLLALDVCYALRALRHAQVWTVEGSTLTVETTNARGTQKQVYKKQL